MKTDTFPAATILLALTAIDSARADAVLDWNIVMQTTVGTQSPFAQARLAAIAQLAVFEATNAIGSSYDPYLGSVTAPADAAAIAAAHGVLKNYFPGNAVVPDAARAGSLAVLPEGTAKTAGIAAGEAAAAAVIAARNNEGSAPAEFYVPGPSNPGEWQSTPGCTAAGGEFFQWRNLKPFGLRGGGQFQLDAPHALTSANDTRDYNEVKAVGGTNSSDRPQDRSAVARFYAVVSPVAVWNPIARQLSEAAGSSPFENARTLALLSMALSDGALATFDSKYAHNSWRPETAIRFGDVDGNESTAPDSSFTPLLDGAVFSGISLGARDAEQCGPRDPGAHPLAHSAERGSQRGSRRRALVVASTAVPGVTLTYTRLKQITEDIHDARFYGGIHFRFDQEAGADLGHQVGEYLFKNHLGAVRGCNCGAR